MKVIAPDNYPAIPIYRVLGLDNMLAEQPDVDPIPNDTLVEWYKHMVLIKQMDDILYEAQRQVSAFLHIVFLRFSRTWLQLFLPRLMNWGNRSAFFFCRGHCDRYRCTINRAAYRST